jgi:hypothetical protein
MKAVFIILIISTSFAAVGQSNKVLRIDSLLSSDRKNKDLTTKFFCAPAIYFEGIYNEARDSICLSYFLDKKTNEICEIHYESDGHCITQTNYYFKNQKVIKVEMNWKNCLDFDLAWDSDFYYDNDEFIYQINRKVTLSGGKDLIKESYQILNKLLTIK